MAQAMRDASDVEPDSDVESVKTPKPLVIVIDDKTHMSVDVDVKQNLKAPVKTAKHNLPIGIKPVASNTQPTFAVAPSIAIASGASMNEPAANVGAGFSNTVVEDFAVPDAEGFQVVLSKKSKRQLNASSTDESSDEETHLKKRPVHVNAMTSESSVEMSTENTTSQLSAANETLYIRGVGYNLVTAIKRQPTAYQNEITKLCGGEVDCSLWKFSGEALRVSLKLPKQRFQLAQATELCGKTVEVSEPWSVARPTVDHMSRDAGRPAASTYAQAVSNGHRLGVVYGVPCDVAPDSIQNLTGALQARRLTPATSENSDSPYSVLLTFDSQPPPYVQVAPFIRLKIAAYTPRPMQCSVCWMFGHTRARCRNRPVCEHCSLRGHTKSECTFVNDAARTKCVNCRGQHEASSRLCQKYAENLEILMLATSKNPQISFKDAQKLFLEQRRKNPTTVQPMPSSETNGTVNAMDTAPVGANEQRRSQGDVKNQSRSRQKSYNYNPNGITLDKSELESIIFSQLVTMRMLHAFIRNNYAATDEQEMALNIIQRAFVKSNDVLIRHQVTLQETNQRLITELQGMSLSLNLAEETMSTAAESNVTVVEPSHIESTISGVQRLSPLNAVSADVASTVPLGPVVADAGASRAEPQHVVGAVSQSTAAISALAPPFVSQHTQPCDLNSTFNAGGMPVANAYQQFWQMPQTPVVMPASYPFIPQQYAQPLTRFPIPPQANPYYNGNTSNYIQPSLQ